jgi:hypothetical protein
MRFDLISLVAPSIPLQPFFPTVLSEFFTLKNQLPMNVITIEHEAFQQITDRLAAIEKGLHQSVEQHFENTWMDGQKVLKLLDISRSTLQAYRDQGKLGFSQIGRKMYYRASEVLAFLENHHQPAFRIRRRQQA